VGERLGGIKSILRKAKTKISTLIVGDYKEVLPVLIVKLKELRISIGNL